MQTLKQKWQNFKTYRQLHEKWNEFKETLSKESSGLKPKSFSCLLNFLDSFKSAVSQLESGSSYKKSQIEKIFGDCSEVLSMVLPFFKLFFENQQGMAGLQTDSGNLLIEVLEILARNEKYTRTIEKAPEVCSAIYQLIEKGENERGIKSGLRLLSSFTLEGKQEVCRTGGVLKAVNLLVMRNSTWTNEVVNTLKIFLEAPVSGNQSQGSLREKLSRVLGGVTKLAWSFFPSEDSSRSNEKFSEDNEEHHIIPPPEAMLRATYSAFQSKFAEIEELEHSFSPGNSPIKEENKYEIIVEEICKLQGIVTGIAKGLAVVASEFKLDLMIILSLLLAGNVRNQKEFRKADGYMLMNEAFNGIPTDTKQGLKLLENCFKILIVIALNGKNSQKIGNVHAFRLILHLGATSPNAWVVKGAIESVQNILNIHWENVVCFYDQGMDYLNLILERNVLENEPSILFCRDSVEIFQVLDCTLRYISFLLGNAWEKNTDILKIYANVIQKNSAQIGPFLLGKMVKSMEEIVADINVRCNKQNALVRSTFLGCFEGMKIAANASLEVLEINTEMALPLIAHLLEYELLYTETFLNSLLSTDTYNTLFSFSLAEKFKGFSKISATGKWVFEKYLVTKCVCEEIENFLFGLIEEGDLLFVVKVLMMEEYPNIDKFRTFKARDRFLNEKGLEIIKKGLPAFEYFWLVLACSKNSTELKNRISISLNLKEIAESMQVSIDSVHILLELATNGNYLEKSDYIFKIVSGLPNLSSEIITQVTQPRYLFDPITSISRHSSTATSTFHMQDKSHIFEQAMLACPIVSSRFVLVLLIFLQRSPAELQGDILKRLLSLCKSFCNKHILSNLHFSKLLLEILPSIHSSVSEICYLIVQSLISYSLSHSEAKVLMENIMDLSIQKIMAFSLSLNLHSNFFYLENQTLDTPTITSFSKHGYSLMFWVKFSKISADLTPIFSWVDHNRGLVLFKLSVMNASDKKISGLDFMKGSIVNEPGNYLVIQAPTQPVFPSPDETAKYAIETSTDWVHIAVVHSKQGVVLYVNTVALPLFKCTNFGNIREKYNVTGVFGSKSAKVLISSVVCVEGALETSQILANYEKESLEKCMFRLPEESPSTLTYSEVTLEDEFWDIKYTPVLNNFYQTSPIKQTLACISAIPDFFSLLKTSKQHLALTFLCQCITDNSSNYKIFIEAGGWSLLGGILVKHDEYCDSDSLEYLFSAVLNKPNFHHKLKKMLVVKPQNIPALVSDRIEGFSVLSELIAALPGNALHGVLDCMSKLFILEENSKIFLSSEINGLMVLLELINNLIKDTYANLEYILLTILEKLLTYFTQDHLEILLEYLSTPELKAHFTKIEKTIESIISIFSVHLYAGNQPLLDKFLNSEGNLLLFEIASSPSETIRCASIRLMGLLLSISAKYRAWFLKSKGFDMLSTILQKQKPSKKVFELLLLLSVNAFNNITLLFPTESCYVKMIINLSDIAAKALPNPSSACENKIVFVEVFEVLFEILKLESDETVKIDLFRNIERLLDAENCEKIMDSAFLMWTSGLVKDTQHLSIPQEKESKNHMIFDTFIVKLCLFDLNRPSGRCKLLYWINRIPDADSFREKCLNSLLNTIKSNPNFDSSDGYVTNKNNFIKNLHNLLVNSELMIGYSAINMKILHLINLLASCNTPSIRQQMKAIGYFDLRDDLIIQMLKDDLPQQQLIEGIQCFSFETIASQPKFRDSNAVIYFIKFLIEFQSAPNLQMEILNLIRNDICVHEENRKYLRKILENKFFLDFLAGFKADDSNSIAQCFRSMKNLKLDEEGESFPENPTAEDFLKWLNHSEKAKKMILGQISKHLNAIDTEHKNNYNKAVEMKAIKRKKAIDSLIKDKTSVQKQVNELELKLITRVTKAEERCTQRFQQHSSFKSQKLLIGARKSL